MFYISRKSFDKNAYGVVDTLDNVEEFFSPEAIKSFLIDYGFEIAGAKLVGSQLEISPVGLRTTSNNQKVAVLYSNACVSAIQPLVGSAHEIRISRYGSYFGKASFMDASNLYSRAELNSSDDFEPRYWYVFDDNVKFVDPNAFGYELRYIGVDMIEVTNPALVAMIHNAYLNTYESIDLLRDKGDRLEMIRSQF